jgi:hypothetical protein
MYEHAYHLEFGANASAYVAAFMRNIDWSAVKLRYEDAIKVAPPRGLEQKQFADVPSISVEEVSAMLKSGTPVQIIDTRPKHYSSKAQDIMEGAVWRDPVPFRRPNLSSRSVSMASTSDARRLQHCARPGLTHDTCQGDTLHGKQSKVR